MIYESGNRVVDKKRTQVKLNSNYDLYHEYVQFIENYARAMFGDNLDVSKLHFYTSDPAKGNAEVEPEKALEQLSSGYPIFVKHDDSPQVLPFMKRGTDIYTGGDFMNVERHPQLNLGFDYEEFMKSPAPARPSIWQYILGFVGLGDGSYAEYRLYNQKLEMVRSNEYSIKQSIAENDGYEYASEIYEPSDFVGKMTRIAKTSVEELKKAPKEVEYHEPTLEELINGDNLNIDAHLSTLGPKNAAMAVPEMPEKIERELEEREADIEKHERMKNSKFMKDVIAEIRLNQGASEEDLLRGVEFIRTMHKDVPENISTKEYLDYANTLILTSSKRDEADASMEAYKQERFNRLGDNIARAIVDQLVKEQEGLNPEETYKTVRFGPTLRKMMTANPLYPTKLARLGAENPAKLAEKYKVQADKDAKKAAQEQKKEEAKKEIAKEPVKAGEKVLGK